MVAFGRGRQRRQWRRQRGVDGARACAAQERTRGRIFGQRRLAAREARRRLAVGASARSGRAVGCQGFSAVRACGASIAHGSHAERAH
jgi:hypothetical protein